MYTNGRGFLQDYKTAVKWYKLAAERGLANPEKNLDVLYAFGDGVQKDYVRVQIWGHKKGNVRDLVEKK